VTLGPFDDDAWGVEFAFVEEAGPGTYTVRVVPEAHSQ
jgi:hypothetical protein